MDPVGSLIEIYKQTDNIILSRLVVIQVLEITPKMDHDEEFDENEHKITTIFLP